MTDGDEVKVHFRMDVDADGRPPASVESLWAVDFGDGTARLENTPWFARGVACGDVVEVGPDEDGVLWAGKKVRGSGHCTIRLIVLEDEGSAAARQAALDDFGPLGTTGEGLGRFSMVALDVPPGADLPAIRRLLDGGAADGRWQWEEGCITAAWQATDTS
ncbi:DUF4265 domain-containing protein [Phytomonospora endophytica]|uniref:DUF4265 domain-containing protein n=1 Tax=Phytomonospora endophytica TaxID=714109 RepID=A0A841FNC2_9ACTN|nr:DUF4265 domain-containing protein [Phytomonospora endophytica]MBB6037344.1 hypothetical protein [Phytomonospora endophytica]GIG69913.1 hypothetical protein Pen01_62080 [Phytomonospora endophytica]